MCHTWEGFPVDSSPQPSVPRDNLTAAAQSTIHYIRVQPTVSKKLCKGIRRDGRPCRGHGLDKYNGYCSVHGPLFYPAVLGRSPGGQTSDGAARRDKRTPDWLQEITDLHREALNRLKEGSLTPEAYAAVCRGIKLKLDIYRRAAKEVGSGAGKRRAPAAKPRAGARQAEAAKPGDAGADLDPLKAVGQITAKQDRYRSESLDAQGFAESESPSDPDEPPRLS